MRKIALILALLGGCVVTGQPVPIEDAAAVESDAAEAQDMQASDLPEVPADFCLACNAIINPCNDLKLYCYRGCCSADPH